MAILKFSYSSKLVPGLDGKWTDKSDFINSGALAATIRYGWKRQVKLVNGIQLEFRDKSFIGELDGKEGEKGWNGWIEMNVATSSEAVSAGITNLEVYKIRDDGTIKEFRVTFDIGLDTFSNYLYTKKVIKEPRPSVYANPIKKDPAPPPASASSSEVHGATPPPPAPATDTAKPKLVNESKQLPTVPQAPAAAASTGASTGVPAGTSTATTTTLPGAPAAVAPGQYPAAAVAQGACPPVGIGVVGPGAGTTTTGAATAFGPAPGYSSFLGPWPSEIWHGPFNVPAHGVKPVPPGVALPNYPSQAPVAMAAPGVGAPDWRNTNPYSAFHGKSGWSRTPGFAKMWNLLRPVQLEYMGVKKKNRGIAKQYWTPKVGKKRSLNRLRRMVITAAHGVGVPPEWLWGIWYRENAYSVIGCAFHSIDKAINWRNGKGDSGIGQGQMLIGVFYLIKKAYPQIWWNHEDQFDPRFSIWTQAFALRRMLDRCQAGKIAWNKTPHFPTWIDIGKNWAGHGCQRTYNDGSKKSRARDAVMIGAAAGGTDKDPLRAPGMAEDWCRFERKAMDTKAWGQLVWQFDEGPDDVRPELLAFPKPGEQPWSSQMLNGGYTRVMKAYL